MIEPGTIGDWTLLVGAMASISALAVGGYRWVLPAEATSVRAERVHAPERTGSAPDLPVAVAFLHAERGVELEEREGAA
jgi:hypothetical protein